MQVNDWGKFSLLGLIIVAATVLALAAVIEGTVAVGVLIYVGGYLTGNGVLARRGQAPSPVLVAPTEAVTTEVVEGDHP